MSNYPDGMSVARSGTIELICDKCSYIWEVPVVSDLGSTELADSDDHYCPNCNKQHS